MERNANHIIPSYYLPVSCRSLVHRYGSLGDCKPQIYFFNIYKHTGECYYQEIYFRYLPIIIIPFINYLPPVHIFSGYQIKILHSHNMLGTSLTVNWDNKWFRRRTCYFVAMVQITFRQIFL